MSASEILAALPTSPATPAGRSTHGLLNGGAALFAGLVGQETPGASVVGAGVNSPLSMANPAVGARPGHPGALSRIALHQRGPTLPVADGLAPADPQLSGAPRPTDQLLARDGVRSLAQALLPAGERMDVEAAPQLLGGAALFAPPTVNTTSTSAGALTGANPSALQAPVATAQAVNAPAGDAQPAPATVPSNGSLLAPATAFAPSALAAAATSAAAASSASGGLATPSTAPSAATAAVTPPTSAPTASPQTAQANSAGAMPDAASTPQPALGAGASTASAGPSTSATAAAQAVAQTPSDGIAGALVATEALGQVRQQGQAQEGQRRVERQERQQAPASAASASAPTASSTSPAPSSATAPAGGVVQADATPAPTAEQPEIVPVVTPDIDVSSEAVPDTVQSEPAVPSASTATAQRDVGVLGLAKSTIETTAMMAAQIIRRLDQRSTRFEMALTPEGLGRVDVSMEIDADGQMAARLAFDNPLAAADLRARADELRRHLEAAGFTLGDDALEFAERDGGASGQAFDRGGEGRSNRAFAGGQSLSDQADALIATQHLTLSLTPAGVDMKV